jgi:LPXTG-site transpeptidase (sortase) family protein
MAATSVDGIVFPEYPPLDNPGGGILWRPSANAGPWPTDGTIAMPALGVKAPIVRVGVDAKTNSMVTPRNARDVAWLDQGPFPGVQQNAVLAGHKNWSGRTGSFDGLARLRNGDPVVVTFGARTWTFKIVWVRLYDPRNAPVDKLMGLTSAPSVTLITCGGAFDRSIRHYRGRVIARAELVQAPSV